MKRLIKKILLKSSIALAVLGFLFTGIVFAAPPSGTGTVEQDMTPESDSTYNLGQDQIRWLNGYFDNLFSENATTSKNYFIGQNLTVSGTASSTDIRTDFIQFNPQETVVHQEGIIYYDSDDNTFVGYNAEADISLNFGEEMWVFARNSTGVTILDGEAVYISGATGNRPNINLAVASSTTAGEVIGVATHDIEDNTDGYITVFGLVRDIDTSSFSAGDTLWLDAITRGQLTNTMPTAPNFPIQIGTVLTSNANTGKVLVATGPTDVVRNMVINELDINVDLRVGGNASTTGSQYVGGTLWNLTKNLTDYSWFYNGSTIHAFDALVQAIGGTASTTVERAGGGDITVRFSSPTGDRILDCSPNKCVIEHVSGDDDNPQKNYIYVLKSDPTNLALSTSDWPVEEHVKITFLFCPSVAEQQSEGGCYINQNWNDFAFNTNMEGGWPTASVCFRRGLGYFSGLDPNGVDQDTNASYFNSISATEAYYKSTAGEMCQKNPHTMPAVDSQLATDDMHVVNSSIVAYREVSDLTDITLDSLGNPLSNKYFALCFFEIGNKTGQYNPTMVKLPSGSYTKQTDAENDFLGFDDCAMPREFVHDANVAVPVVRMVLRYTGGFGTLSHISSRDLREVGNTSGSSGIGVTTYLGLVDTPNDRAGFANYLIGVNAGETADEYITDINISNATITNHFEADATLYVKDSRVGIGTNNPATTLEVSGTASTTALVVGGAVTFNDISGSTQCLHVDSNGVVTGTGSDCGAGGGGGNPFDQWLDTTSTPQFGGMTITGTLLINESNILLDAATNSEVNIGFSENGTGNERWKIRYRGDSSDNFIISRYTDAGFAANTLILSNADIATFSDDVIVGGNVGIGESPPSDTKLMVSANIDTPLLTLKNSGDLEVDFIIDAANNDFAIDTNVKSDAIVINGPDGNVGIGTDSPVAVLDVNGTFNTATTTITGTVTITPNPNAGGGGIVASTVGDQLRLDGFIPNIYFDDNSASAQDFGIYVNSNIMRIGRATSSTSFDPSITIGPNGNVGIGIDEPFTPLQIVKAGGVPAAMFYNANSDVINILNDQFPSQIRMGNSMADSDNDPLFIYTASRGSLSNPSVLFVDDNMGRMFWNGFDGGQRRAAANFGVRVENISIGQIGGQFFFNTFINNVATEQMTIMNNGDIGMGNDNPQDKLHITKANGAGGVGIRIQNDANTNDEYTFLNFYNTTSNDNIGGQILSKRVDLNNSTFTLSNRQSGILTTAMFIDSAGDVGFGISSSLSGKIHTFEATADNFLYVESDGARSILTLDGTKTSDGELALVTFLNAGDSVALIGASRVGANDAADLRFATQEAGGSLTTRFIVKSDGNIEISNQGLFTRGVAIISKEINYDDGSPIVIASVDDGYVVVDVYIEITTVWDGNGSITIGDGDDPDGFLQDIGITQTSLGYYGTISATAGFADNRGPYLTSPVGLGSFTAKKHIYTSADTIDATIVQGTSNQGQATVYIVIQKLK